MLAVMAGGDAVAYPVRQIAYHHLVEDSVGGGADRRHLLTLCHTGLVWERTVDGRALRFRLAGINNRTSSCRTRRPDRGGSR